VNGRSAGRHDGGYAGFRFDVTELLRPGRNTVAVRTDNSNLTHVAPLQGDFSIFGGVYRPVALVSTADLHVDMLDHGGPGVYARTQTLASDRAVIGVRTRVRNDGPAPANAVVRISILDAEGRTVAQRADRIAAPARRTREAAQTLSIPRPRLWRGRADPYLYRVRAEVLSGPAGAVLDAVTVPLGVRTVAVDPERGFLLNGRPYRLYGANLSHPGRPGRGLAVTDAEIDEDLRIMAEMGVTGLRLTHVQHPPRVYERADQLGLLLSTEAPLVDKVSEGPDFLNNAAQQMRELIRQTYNHPSVVVWGLGNEQRTSSAAANAVLAQLQRIAKAEDPDRPTAYSHCCLKDDDPLADHADLLAFNRYYGWYGGEFAQFGRWLDTYRREHPRRLFAVSEYGAGASIWQQEDPPRQPDPDGPWHPEQWQALLHEAYWREIEARPYLWSSFVWVAYDFASDRRNEGDRAGINDKGLVTYDRRTRKQAYHWYQANWSEEPMAHITSRRHVLRRNPLVEVKVYSNRPAVALQVNGVNLGQRPVEGRIARWTEVRLAPGRNLIRVTAGEGVSDQVEWTYEPETAGIQP